MRGVIDADTHIVEHPGIWEHMDREFYPRRPVIVKAPSDTWYGSVNAFWLLDGEIFPRPVGKGSFGLHVPGGDREEAREDVPPGVRNLTDVPGRLAALEARDVEAEVIYPTLFIMYLTDDVDLEIALCRAYNRYMADVWKQGGGQLRWVAPLPLRSVEASVAEMRVAQEGGAVGLLFRGVEGTRSLAEPYFYPVYQEAARLGLPICVHTGGGSPAITKSFDITYSHVFPHVRVTPLFAFRDIVAHKVPERFPGLRFAFVEAASSWVPYVLHLLRRAAKAPITVGPLGPSWDSGWGPKLFQDYNLYVACEADEDIPYLLKYVGEDNLIIGSDYGHQDQSRDDGVVALINRREDIPPSARTKMLSDNPRRLYGM
ncbi:MAG: amidohydrolase [Dehalococcoidia bacterium]|nr:amidohydrolase [Dehalococcoidia bacterium]